MASSCCNWKKDPGPLFSRDAASVTRESCCWRYTIGAETRVWSLCGLSSANDTMAVGNKTGFNRTVLTFPMTNVFFI
ncbi:LOW QUALITY PROTEIN: uncharacterized protein LOC130511430 [Raphanus sativus]|uniref:LOW QUALITY PROTEIN: uncharacterized protein LOC130511430 n=1 Tax=Raphanus sativus TaxID=3726 RepID=A0A9W3DKI7_RAPSA|nr:LOW QUALITY PROTEIN: uncharacterized protein LOC130511430 [Raphanus sativus]